MSSACAVMPWWSDTVNDVGGGVGAGTQGFIGKDCGLCSGRRGRVIGFDCYVLSLCERLSLPQSAIHPPTHAIMI